MGMGEELSYWTIFEHTITSKYVLLNNKTFTIFHAFIQGKKVLNF